MKKPWLTLTALVTALFLAGCVSTPPRKDMGPPDTHAIVFGSLLVKSDFLPQSPTSIRMIQVNLEAAPHIVNSYGHAGRFYTAPLPVGECLKLLTFKTSSYNLLGGGGSTTTTYYLGLQGKTAMDAEITAPGLHFLGSFLLSIKPDGSFAYEEDRKTTELSLLRDLLPGYIRTAWEPVIKARIKELEK